MHRLRIRVRPAQYGYEICSYFGGSEELRFSSFARDSLLRVITIIIMRWKEAK